MKKCGLLQNPGGGGGEKNQTPFRIQRRIKNNIKKTKITVFLQYFCPFGRGGGVRGSKKQIAKKTTNKVFSGEEKFKNL